jgi:hypothetical protein
MPKNPKFTSNEDIWLARAWVKASQDPVTGTQQTKDMFWAQIFEYWKSFHLQDAPDVEINPMRTQASLYSRFQKNIAVDCKKMDVIRKRNPQASGENDERYLSRCLELYQLEYGSPFRFSGCLEVLEEVPIFSLGASTGLKSSGSAIDENGATEAVGGGGVETVNVELPRPMGAKRAKRKIEVEGRLAKGKKAKTKAVEEFSKVMDDGMKMLGRALEGASKADTRNSKRNERNSMRDYYMKMVERLEKKGGQEAKVEKYLEKLGQLEEELASSDDQEEEEEDEHESSGGSSSSPHDQP